MIEHIRTVGFKGFNIDEDVSQKAIYTGRNKSGKSTRSGAIAIALYGHIPFSTAGKRPSDILDSFGKDELVVSVTIKGMDFARRFKRNPKGGVSQSFQIDKKKASAENFAILLNRAGDPRIADVAEFMKQSDAKKTDTLFELFPNDALSGIDTEIETAKEDVSRLEKKKNGAESTVVRLTNSKKAIEIPSGSIAETKAEIKSVESQIVDLDEQIRKAEIEEAGIKREKELKDRAGLARWEMLKEIGVELDISDCREMEESAWVKFFNKENSEYQTEKNKIWIEEQKEKKEDDPIDEIISRGEDQIEGFNGKESLKPEVYGGGRPGKFDGVMDATGYGNNSPDPVLQLVDELNPVDSIQRIIDALNAAGCGTCAALIVAKHELKKYKGCHE